VDCYTGKPSGETFLQHPIAEIFRKEILILLYSKERARKFSYQIFEHIILQASSKKKVKKIYFKVVWTHSWKSLEDTAFMVYLSSPKRQHSHVTSRNWWNAFGVPSWDVI